MKKVGEQQLISKWFGEFGLRNSAEEVSGCPSNRLRVGGVKHGS